METEGKWEVINVCSILSRCSWLMLLRCQAGGPSWQQRHHPPHIKTGARGQPGRRIQRLHHQPLLQVWTLCHLRSSNRWVKSNPNSVKWLTRRRSQKGMRPCWVIYTQHIGMKSWPMFNPICWIKTINPTLGESNPIRSTSKATQPVCWGGGTHIFFPVYNIYCSVFLLQLRFLKIQNFT